MNTTFEPPAADVQTMMTSEEREKFLTANGGGYRIRDIAIGVSYLSRGSVNQIGEKRYPVNNTQDVRAYVSMWQSEKKLKILSFSPETGTLPEFGVCTVGIYITYEKA